MKNVEMKDYYKILELTSKCTEDEIRKNYRKLAMRYHPDRNPDDPAAEEKFKEVAEAYGVLTDPKNAGNTTVVEPVGNHTKTTVLIIVRKIFLKICLKTPDFNRCLPASSVNFRSPVFATALTL